MPPTLQGFFGLLVATLLAACDRSYPCPTVKTCPGTQCWCDASGRLKTWEIHRPGSQTTVWQRYANRYDDRNRLSKVRWDKDGDGTFDLETEYLYNPADEAVAAKLDWKLDGTVDEECRYRVPCQSPPLCGPRECHDVTP